MKKLSDHHYSTLSFQISSEIFAISIEFMSYIITVQCVTTLKLVLPFFCKLWMSCGSVWKRWIH